MVLVLGMVISTGTLVAFASSGMTDVKGVTSQSSSGELLESASKNLEAVAIGVRNSLDGQMADQYQLIKTLAKDPAIIETATKAQGYSVDELYEMWSTQTLRKYNEGKAIGDSNPDNDLAPAVSKFFANISVKTNFMELSLTDSRGYVIAASSKTDDFDQGPDNWTMVLKNDVPVLEKDNPNELGEDWYNLTKEMKSGFYVSQVIWGEKTCKIEIVNTIIDPATYKYLGQIKGVFNYGTFVYQFANVDRLDVYELKVVDPNGTILTTSLTDKTKINNPKFNLTNDYTFGSAIALSNGTISDPYADENGETVCAGYAKSADLNSHIVLVTRKIADMEAPINEFVGGLQNAIGEKSSALIKNMIIIGAVVAVVILVVAFLIIFLKVSRPLKKLTVISDKLSQGELEGLTIDIHGKDEIASFGEHFKGVLAAFNYLKDELENKK